MKSLALAGAVACALALSGCANGVNSVTGAINDLTGALSSPAANQAAANLKAGAMAVVCDVSSLAALDVQINAQIDAGTVIDRDATTVYAVSSTLCVALGGKVTGNAIVPAAAAAQ